MTLKSGILNCEPCKQSKRGVNQWLGNMLMAGFLPALVACGASFSEKECAHTDWRAKGMQDFKEGQSPAAIENYHSICKFEEPLKISTLYQEGFESGIAKYCHYDFGYRRGRQDAAQLKYCPSDSNYYKGFERGREELQEERDRRKLQNLQSQSGQDVSGMPRGPDGPPAN